MISLEPRAAVIFRLTNMSSKNSTDKLDRIVSEEQGYRSKALKMYPWVCGRCAREFDEKNLRELTVHHRDHDHDNNPADGSNWELLCVYCHDNEHSRYVDAAYGDSATTAQAEEATHKPFADLASMLGKEK
jgi:5-methylcytosine-specific restriction endonuclease McrA